MIPHSTLLHKGLGYQPAITKDLLAHTHAQRMRVRAAVISLLLQVVVVVVGAAAATTAAAATATSTTSSTRRFARQGPVLTVTVPADPSFSGTKSADLGTTTTTGNSNILGALEPTVTYAIASQQPPLPLWLPALKSLSAGIGYQYQHVSPRILARPNEPESNDNNSQDARRRRRRWMTPTTTAALPLRPSWLETCAKWQFQTVLPNVVWQVQPRHDWSTSSSTESTSSVVASATRGAQSLYARWSRRRHPMDFAEKSSSKTTPTSSSTTTTAASTGDAGWGLEAVRASLYWSLPLASLASIRITPQLSLQKSSSERAKRGLVSCQVEAVTGGMGRTVATLTLSSVKPTLSVQYQPDAYNWIAPTIDLFTGHMQYQWIMALPHQSGSVHTTVDPATAITVTWTDRSRSQQTDETTSSAGDGSGSSSTWVTDICIPLTGTSSLRNLAADIRVRRQFRF
jgi:type II secretory pathway pseudopilin PulG